MLLVFGGAGEVEGAVVVGAEVEVAGGGEVLEGGEDVGEVVEVDADGVLGAEAAFGEAAEGGLQPPLNSAFSDPATPRGLM